MTRFFGQRGAVIALVGAITMAIGYITAPTADAQVQTMHLWVQPGTNAGTADMTCGWHSTCPSGSGGSGLDWVNDKTAYDGGKPVQLRAWASYSGSPPGTPIRASAASHNPIGFCKYLDLTIRRPNGVDLGIIRYTHVGHAIGGLFNFNAGSTLQLTVRQIGTTLHYSWEDDVLDCPPSGPNPGWTDSHIHQGASSGTWAKNGLYPDSGDTPNTKDNVDVNSQSWWVNAVTFQY